MTHSNDGKDEKGALRADQNSLMFGQGFSFSGYERDPLYLNLGGKKFTDISGVSGIDSITDGRAGVFADFDNDGDLDVFSTTIQHQAHLLFRNNVGQDSNFLRIELEGTGNSTRDLRRSAGRGGEGDGDRAVRPRRARNVSRSRLRGSIAVFGPDRHTWRDTAIADSATSLRARRPTAEAIGAPLAATAMRRRPGVTVRRLAAGTTIRTSSTARRHCLPGPAAQRKRARDLRALRFLRARCDHSSA